MKLDARAEVRTELVLAALIEAAARRNEVIEHHAHGRERANAGPILVDVVQEVLPTLVEMHVRTCRRRDRRAGLIETRVVERVLYFVPEMIALIETEPEAEAIIAVAEMHSELAR